LLGGEWTSIGGVNVSTVYNLSLVAGLSGGQALKLTSTNFGAIAYGPNKTLGANYAQHIGGRWFKADLLSTYVLCSFQDSLTSQCCITVETTGKLGLRSGGPTGTLLASSSLSVSANSVHCAEWSVTINHTTGAATVYLDGAASGLTFSGNTRGGTANDYYNGISYGMFNSSTGSVLTVDNEYDRFYLVAGADTPALDCPRVETQFPVSDASVQFTPGAGVLGADYSITANTNAPGANELFLRQFTPQVNATINSVSILPEATSAGAKFKAVIYSDSAGAPNALLSSGTEVVGATSGTVLTGPLVTPQALTAGTPYWIGFITDTSVALAQVDTTTTGSKAANTYGSGAPGTAPGMTGLQPSWIVFGNCTGQAHNWAQVAAGFSNPPLGDPSYNSDSTVGHADLFNFPALTSAPTTVHTVAVKAYMERSDAGARTVNLQTHSGSTTGNGSTAGITPATSYGFQSSYFDQDPNGPAAWTPTGVNAATSGYQIAT
jgi:hypothetical protein